MHVFSAHCCLLVMFRMATAQTVPLGMRKAALGGGTHRLNSGGFLARNFGRGWGKVEKLRSTLLPSRHGKAASFSVEVPIPRFQVSGGDKAGFAVKMSRFGRPTFMSGSIVCKSGSIGRRSGSIVRISGAIVGTSGSIVCGSASIDRTSEAIACNSPSIVRGP